ncbi:TPA: MarR family transcriptional regulator [Pseudomonas aeruginosa]|nr:MarR family transcriptional regulator [Pseudomonas aeruginosa]
MKTAVRSRAPRATDAVDDPLLLDQQVCFPVYAASNMLTRIYRPVLEPLGLTYSQYLVMLVLWEQSPTSVGALGKRLHLDTGTLTPLLKRMEHGGFISRRRDLEDERRVLIEPTAHGRDLRCAAMNVPNTLSQQLGLEDAEVDELRNAVKAFVRVLAGDKYSTRSEAT